MQQNISYKILSKKQYSTILNLEEIKNYLKISSSSDDALLMNILESVVDIAENLIGGAQNSLRLKEILLQVSNLKYINRIKLKYLPICNLEKILLCKETQVTELHQLALSREDLLNIYNNLSEKKDITECFKYLDNKDQELFIQRESFYDVIIVHYTAGYNRESIPKSLKQALLMHIYLIYDSQYHDSALLAEINTLYKQHKILKI